jgi:hypothetical protein
LDTIALAAGFEARSLGCATAAVVKVMVVAAAAAPMIILRMKDIA